MNTLGISGLDRSVPFKRRMLPGLDARAYRIAQGMDSAAALVTSRGICAAAAEERFSGEKGTPSFPVNALRYCLRQGRLKPADIDVIAHGFDYEPFRIAFLDGAGEYAQRQFMEVYSREALVDVLQRHVPVLGGADIVQVPHHLAHAASAFYPSGMEEALIVVADGMGEVHSTTVAVGCRDDLTILKQILAPNSLGILYGVFTLYLGFWMALDEYKVMGLAPYGDPRRYLEPLGRLVELRPRGSFAIPVLGRNETLEEKETYAGTLRLLEESFGPRREPGAPITARHRHIAAALQLVLQRALFHMLEYYRRETGLRTLCMAGGVALNCTANGAILRSRLFDQVFIQPAAGDDGTALGSALYVQHQREPGQHRSKMTLPYWGPSYTSRSIGRLLEALPGGEVARFESEQDLCRAVSELLAAGQIVGWFQGRMEFGPRALGSRSILADPRDALMRERVNRLVKKREAFRPFAPAVPEEDAGRYFEIDPGTEATYAHMLFTAPVRPEFRSLLPAVTHIDGSARVQTVSRAHHPLFWSLLRAFGERTGIPVLLNTSFNVKGQPIVCTPSEALATFQRAGLDALVMGNFLVSRTMDARTNPPASTIMLQQA